MTPGSARARIEKETENGSELRSETAMAADKTDGSIAKILGRQWTNKRNPGPCWTRDANSPDAGAMRRGAHRYNGALARGSRQVPLRRPQNSRMWPTARHLPSPKCET